MKILLPGADGFSGRHIACRTSIFTAFQMVWALRHGTAGQTARPLARQLLWFALGWPAFAALVAIFWLMVSKPAFI